VILHLSSISNYIVYIFVIMFCQEYSLRVQSGCIPDQYHHVTKRYSDFAALDSVLRGYGIDFSLPPKKVFGKMDSDFIEQRQRGLQVLIYSVLMSLKISLYMKR